VCEYVGDRAEQCMVLSRGYVAEKEDETEGEDEGGGGRGTRESRTYAGPYRRVHIRRLEANREKAERADGKEKKNAGFPGSVDSLRGRRTRVRQ